MRYALLPCLLLSLLPLACQVDDPVLAADGGGPDLGPRCEAAADCDDGDPCTRDTCVAGRCVVGRAPQTPLSVLGTVPVEGALAGLWLQGDQLWVSWRDDRASGLTTWDLTPLPAALQTQRRLAEADEGAFGPVAVVEGRVYVGEAPARVRALDADGAALGVQRTSDPVQALTPLPGTQRVVAAVFGKGLEVLGFGNPAEPRRVARLDTPGRALQVVVRPNRWYVADGLGGLLQIDARDVADPRRLPDPVPTAGRAVGLDERDGRVLLAEHGAGVGVIDLLADPRPARLATLTPGAPVHAVAFVDPRLAVAAGDTNGLLLIDLLRPTEPTLWGSVGLPAAATHLSLDGHRVAVGHGGGVTLLAVTCAAPPEVDGGVDGGLDGGLDAGRDGAP